MGFGLHRQVGLPSTEALAPADYCHSLNLRRKHLAAWWDGIRVRPLVPTCATEPAMGGTLHRNRPNNQ